MFIIVFLLLFISGYISANEEILFWLSQGNAGRIKKEEDKLQNKFLCEVLEMPGRLIHALSIFRSALHIVIVVLVLYRLSLTYYQGFDYFYLMVATGLIILIFLFNRIMPRLMLRKNAWGILLRATPFLQFIYWLCKPLTKPISVLAEAEDMSESHEDDLIATDKDTPDEKGIKKDMIRLYNKTADEIMVPHMDIKAIDIKSSFDEVMDSIIKTGFSRIPVYENTEDDIKGILYVKDMIMSVHSNETSQWQRMIRPAYFVPETKRIDSLLEEFRTNKVHIAIVVDEFGCTSGLVTLEDIIEEIVGEIADEFDNDERYFVLLPDGSYIFEGKIQLNDFFRETNTDPADFRKLTEEIDTLAGLLLKIKGTLPCRREIIQYDNYRFQILEADERRVLKVKFSAGKRLPKKTAAKSVASAIILLCICLFSCTKYTPKPRGFFRIDIPDASYENLGLKDLPYSFNVSQLATIELPPAGEPAEWLNLSYETLHAKVYCTHHFITPRTFPAVEKECRELVKRTVKNATSITEQAYESPDIHIYGTLFMIEGETPSPIQFMLTDSVRHFFRGALYYRCKMNVDSLAPINSYLRDNIAELMQSFQWK
ncbi:MAG: CNNM domain-containing protein [Tannerella sp.]|nr:CNNM domain-containing protein [Tannerella sp.]